MRSLNFIFYKIFFILLLTIQLLACDSSPNVQIFNKAAEITANPLTWEGRSVRLKGTVSNQLAVPFVDSALYELRDETGTIHIVSKGGLPAKGETVALTGKVKNTVVFGSVSMGLVVMEESRF